MPKYRDILLDENFVPVTRDGDFVIGDSIDQEVDLIMAASRGQSRRNILLGPEMFRYMNGAIQAEDLEGHVKLHLAIDRKRSRVELKDGDVIIDAEQE